MRNGSPTACPVLGVLQPSDQANYFCFTTRDDGLNDDGSFVYCGF